jgi:predicted PurR-regulated permease PerM
MIAFRLPKFREYLGCTLWVQRALPIARQMRTALGGWLKAQLQLAGVCFLSVGVGLMLLGIPRPLLWAGLITLVDAVPLLGTGAILLPWAAISFFQGQQIKALGLAAVCVTAMLSRSILEPRLLGKQLGLDSLVTLAALYAGFRLWGFGGMLLAPVLCVAAFSFSGQQLSRKK